MSCASASGSEDNFEINIFQEDDDYSQDEDNFQEFKTILSTDPKMAETHDINQYRTMNCNEVFEDDNDGNDTALFNKQQQSNHLKDDYNSYTGMASFCDQPVDDLLALANDDATAVETANLLLAEHQPNFVDFDEFNICLNNILNEDVDSQLELSPSVVISDTLTTVEVDDLFKVNSDFKNNKSQTHMTISTFNENNSSKTNSNNSCNSSSDSTSHKTSAHTHKQMPQTNLNDHGTDNMDQADENHDDEDDDDDDLLNMVQLNDHMDFSFSSELENTTCVTSFTTAIHKSKYNQNSLNTKHCLNLHAHTYPHEKNVARCSDSNGDINLNEIMEETINIQPTYNPALAGDSCIHNNVGASVGLDNDGVDSDTPQETALNNIIKHNSHSIVNISQ